MIKQITLSELSDELAQTKTTKKNGCVLEGLRNKKERDKIGKEGEK